MRACACCVASALGTQGKALYCTISCVACILNTAGPLRWALGVDESVGHCEQMSHCMAGCALADCKDDPWHDSLGRSCADYAGACPPPPPASSHSCLLGFSLARARALARSLARSLAVALSRSLPPLPLSLSLSLSPSLSLSLARSLARSLSLLYLSFFLSRALTSFLSLSDLLNVAWVDGLGGGWACVSRSERMVHRW